MLKNKFFNFFLFKLEMIYIFATMKTNNNTNWWWPQNFQSLEHCSFV